MRWLPAYSRALTSSDGVGNSMRWSWRETDHWQLPLGIALLFPVLCYGLAMIAYLAYDYANDFVGWTGYTLLAIGRSEEHTSELQSLMRISYDVFCLKKK